MSEQYPQAPAPGEPEYLGPGGTSQDPAAPSRGPRWALLAGVGVAVVAAVAGGGYGLAQLMSGSGSPADAVPADAVAYASLDLDPSASQKIEAIQTLRKFPALKKELDLDARDDVRRWVVENIVDDAGCTSVTYADDIAPWIGERMAVAAVPDAGSEVAPLFVVQVGDQAAATTGLRAIAACAGDTLGIAFVGDYAVLAEKQADADAYAAAAEAAPLSEDSDYQTWTDRAGDAGVLNAYVSADAPARMGDLAASMSGDPVAERVGQDVTELYRDFEGAAAVLRFDDGRIEVETVTAGLPGGAASVGTPSGPSLSDLPATTAAAFTVSFADGWVEEWMSSLGDLFGSAATGGGPLMGAGGADDLWRDLEAQTGLELPEDLEALLGDGVRVSLDAGFDLDALSGSGVPQAPVGIRINGDEAEITRVLDALLAQAPGNADVLKRSAGEGYVVLGLDQAYVDRLAGDPDGALGDEAAFEAVVPEPERVSSGLFVNFDAEDWAVTLAEATAPHEPEVAANLAPLDALGLTAWLDDDDVDHVVLRVSTD